MDNKRGREKEWIARRERKGVDSEREGVDNKRGREGVDIEKEGVDSESGYLLVRRRVIG